MSKVFDSLKALVGAKASTFVHVERELAELLGVAQDVVKEQRQALQLTRGADWELVKGAVTYSDAAAKKILERLKGEPPGGAPPAPDLAPNTGPATPAPAPRPEAAGLQAADPAASVALLCVKLPRNRRIIMARLASDKTAPLVRVRVKDSGNFSPGMELQARPLGADLYVLDGRAPRFPGKF